MVLRLDEFFALAEAELACGPVLFTVECAAEFRETWPLLEECRAEALGFLAVGWALDRCDELTAGCDVGLGAWREDVLSLAHTPFAASQTPVSKTSKNWLLL